MNELSRLFGPFNLKIVELLIDKDYSVRELAKNINCSPAKITQFVKLFKKANFVEIKKDQNKKIITLRKSNPFIRQIISLIFVYKIINSKAFIELKKNSKSIGLYGSAAEGNVDKQSDIDLWVLCSEKKSVFDEGKIRRQLSKELGREVSLRFLTPSNVELLKKNDKIFFSELENKSKILFGEGIE